MAQVGRLLRFVALTVVAYFVFGLSGQYSALGFLRLTGNNDAVGWLVYSAGIVLAVLCVAFSWNTRRTVRRLSPLARWALAGFAAFFCWQWTVAGTPDWNPAPLLIGFLVCTGAGIAVLRFSAVGTDPVPDSAFEQAHRADGVR